MTPPSLFPRRRERPRTCLADPTEMQLQPASGLFQVWDIAPEQYRRCRKHWELDYLVDCAERLNLLRSDVRALGMGAGREVLMFYFARHCKQVVATDLYSADTHWREANAGGLQDIYQAAPFEYPRERLQIEVSDMRKTGFADNSFDFVWSCSSLEHVPTLYDVYQTLVETHRVLRPGGHALITMEYCLFDPPYLLNGMNAMDENLVELLLAKLGGIELVGPVDLSYNCAHPLCVVGTRQYMFADYVSKSQQYALPFDYVHLMGLSAIIPIGFVLQKTSLPMTSWEELPLPDVYRTYDNACNLHLQERPEVVLRDLLQLITSPKETVNLQLRLQAIAILLLYADHDSNPNSEANVSHLLDLFISSMPEGEVQDPNLLPIIAHYFRKIGKNNQVAQLYRQAALSPSAFADHAISLAIEHLKLQLEMKRNITDDDPLPMIIKDLLLHGYSMSWIKRNILKAISGDELPPILAEITDKVKMQVFSEVQSRAS